MSTVTSKAREKSREIGREQQKTDKRKVDGLTCSEAEVEAILSEGEST